MFSGVAYNKNDKQICELNLSKLCFLWVDMFILANDLELGQCAMHMTMTCHNSATTQYCIWLKSFLHLLARAYIHPILVY